MGALLTCCRKPSNTDSDPEVQREVVNVRNGEVYVEKVDKTDYNDAREEQEVQLEVDDEMMAATAENRTYAAPPPPRRQERKGEADSEVVMPVTEQRMHSAPPPQPKAPETGETSARRSRVQITKTAPEEKSPSEESPARISRRSFGGAGGGSVVSRTTTETVETKTVTRSSIPTRKAPQGGEQATKPKVTIVREYDKS